MVKQSNLVWTDWKLWIDWMKENQLFDVDVQKLMIRYATKVIFIAIINKNV